MKITEQMKATRNSGSYIAASVHYSRRKFDKRYEIIARATDTFLNENELNIGGEIVLDIRGTRQEALDAVRFYRKQETA